MSLKSVLNELLRAEFRVQLGSLVSHLEFNIPRWQDLVVRYFGLILSAHPKLGVSFEILGPALHRGEKFRFQHLRPRIDFNLGPLSIRSSEWMSAEATFTKFYTVFDFKWGKKSFLTLNKKNGADEACKYYV